MRLLPWEYAVRNLRRSPLRSSLAVFGSALVVLLVIAASAFVRGMEASLQVPGAKKNVILLGAGSEESLERSEIPAGGGSIVAASIPGIKTRLGQPYVSPEVQMALEVRTESGGDQKKLGLLRGVTPTAFLVHSQVRIAEGKAPGPGEVIAGKLAATRLGVPDEELAIGRSIVIDDQSWKVVGIFEAPGTVLEAEIWCVLTDLQVAAKRDSLSCVVLTLDDAELADVELFCKQRLDLEMVAIGEQEYYEKIYLFYQPVRWMIWITALLIGTSGILGGINTLYAAFASRVRELGSLQAIGYPRRAIALSLAQESLLGCVTGTLIAAAAGLIFIDGLAVRFSMGAFTLLLDAPVMTAGLGAGLLMGVLGALPPTLRCLLLPIPEALKSA